VEQGIPEISTQYEIVSSFVDNGLRQCRMGDKKGTPSSFPPALS
jgi:hypothetical protein